jgi:hypothetical protein
MLLKKFEVIENTLFFKKKLWVSKFDQLKLNIIREIHDKSASEHSNMRRTHKHLKNDIIDDRRKNQLKDTFETVIFVKDSKQLETDILNCWISCQYQIDRE